MLAFFASSTWNWAEKRERACLIRHFSRYPHKIPPLADSCSTNISSLQRTKCSKIAQSLFDDQSIQIGWVIFCQNQNRNDPQCWEKCDESVTLELSFQVVVWKRLWVSPLISALVLEPCLPNGHVKPTNSIERPSLLRNDHHDDLHTKPSRIESKSL